MFDAETETDSMLTIKRSKKKRDEKKDSKLVCVVTMLLLGEKLR
jgi:hypothetical protein